jgi:predicted esterase YcpF (UPF0227 family)
MKSTIIYLHGFGSSPQSETAQDIQKAFPNEKFMAPSIDHNQHPDVLKKQMDDLAEKLKKHDDPIIVGSSAGGFWGDYMAAKHGIKTVLLNPSLKPSENYKKYNLPKGHYAAYKKLENASKGHARHHVVAFHGTEDTVVPKEHIQTHYQNPVDLPGEGHRILNLKPVINTIGNMIGNFPEHH